MPALFLNHCRWLKCIKKVVQCVWFERFRNHTQYVQFVSGGEVSRGFEHSLIFAAEQDHASAYVPVGCVPHEGYAIHLRHIQVANNDIKRRRHIVYLT